MSNIQAGYFSKCIVKSEVDDQGLFWMENSILNGIALYGGLDIQDKLINVMRINEGFGFISLFCTEVYGLQVQSDGHSGSGLQLTSRHTCVTCF